MPSGVLPCALGNRIALPLRAARKDRGYLSLRGSGGVQPCWRPPDRSNLPLQRYECLRGLLPYSREIASLRCAALAMTGGERGDTSRPFVYNRNSAVISETEVSYATQRR